MQVASCLLGTQQASANPSNAMCYPEAHTRVFSEAAVGMWVQKAALGTS
jgi:hypothetical protein